MSTVKAMLSCAVALALSGCGFFTPEKDLFSNDNVDPPNASPGGMFEQNVVAHIRCEIRNGLWKAVQLPNVGRWLSSYGATVTLKLTYEEQSGISPGISFLQTLPNAQTFTAAGGLSGTGNATRVETIQFTFSNAELLAEAAKDFRAGIKSCEGYQHGVMIESDLKIGQFIYDKAVVAGAAGEATSKGVTTPPYSQFQWELTFVASFGGNFTPTWKFTRITVNPSTPLVTATRTNTQYMLMTIGPVAQGPSGKSQPQLTADTKALHSAALIGSATATSIDAFVTSR